MSVAQPHTPAAPARPSGRQKALASLIAGTAGVALGFLVVPLALAVAAITLASLAFQEMDGSPNPRGAENRRSMAVAGMILGIVALCVWIPALLAIAIARS